MVFILLFFSVLGVALFAIIYTLDHKPKKQPEHFDLLDENGDPLPPQVKVSVVQDEDVEVQELQYFCLKDKGYHVSVWPRNQNFGDYIDFFIAGIAYRDNIDKYLGEHEGTLEPEPTNTYDPNAIKVLAEDGHHVGYVPKNMTAEIRQYSTLTCKCYFYIGEYLDDDGRPNYFSDCYINLKEVSPNQNANS